MRTRGPTGCRCRSFAGSAYGQLFDQTTIFQYFYLAYTDHRIKMSVWLGPLVNLDGAD
jgi:hypothetical protein